MTELMERRRALMAAQKKGSSNMHGWTSGVPYRNLDTVARERVQYNSGAFVRNASWSRTGYVPCEGASRLEFAPQTGQDGSQNQYNAFYDKDYTWLGRISINTGAETNVQVPQNAAYFAILAMNTVFTHYITSDSVIPYK